MEQALASRTLDRPVKSLLAVRGPLRFGDYQWNDRAVPDGPLWIRVDLGAQLISVFRSGHEIGTSVIVYGGDNKQTPGGRLHILARDKDHRSSIYDADMPYTLQLTYDGVAIHGSDVRWGKATHGCVGVPLQFARRLFDVAKVGDEVVIIPVSAKAAATTYARINQRAQRVSKHGARTHASCATRNLACSLLSQRSPAARC